MTTTSTSVTDSSSTTSSRVLLLVEDNPADADLVQEYLHDRSRSYDYEVYHEICRADALRRLETLRPDVILLDLRLPDSPGLESVQAVREAAGDTPIIVLTGTDHEELGLSCIQLGAQDYLCKSEVRPASLRRAVGYAIARRNEAQLRELQETVDMYRALSSSPVHAPLVGPLSGLVALRERRGDEFKVLVRMYGGLLEAHLAQAESNEASPRESMELLVTELGNLGAGPRDLIDIHLEALVDALLGKDEHRIRWLALEGRLLALEMMGLLVEFYRLGTCRSSSIGRLD